MRRGVNRKDTRCRDGKGRIGEERRGPVEADESRRGGKGKVWMKMTIWF